MDALTRDDLLHAVDQTLSFYGKRIDQASARFWINAFNGRDPDQAKRALLEYTKVGKYAPKPVDVIEIMDSMREAERSNLPPPPRPTSSCPQHVADAWSWFLGRMAEGSRNLSGLFQENANVDVPTQEAYLQIVNEQARQFDTPDAIPDQYKLPEVWA